MPVIALSAESRRLYVGDVWWLDVLVLDADREPYAVEPTLTITLPDGTAPDPLPTVEGQAGGYRFAFTTTMPGRHLATVTAAGYGRAEFVATAVTPTPTGSLPTIVDVEDYLTSGSGTHEWSDQDLADALAAETAAQAAVCRIRAYYPPDLREALLRRVQRNLALRPNALAMFRGDADTGDPQAFLPSQDPEVRRLERPHRKLPIG